MVVPVVGHAQFNLGTLLAKTGRRDDAEAAYLQAADVGHPAAISTSACCWLMRAVRARPRTSSAAPPTPDTRCHEQPWAATCLMRPGTGREAFLG